MIIRVVRQVDDELIFVGNIESEDSPAIGDTFWYETNGPYRVIDRTWHFPSGFNDRAETATLVVEPIPLGNAI